MKFAVIGSLLVLSLAAGVPVGVATAAADTGPCVVGEHETSGQTAASTGFSLSHGAVGGITVAPTSVSGVGGSHMLEPGERVRVRGVTNLRPDRNVITVALAQNGTVLGLPREADSWGTDGVWSVTLRVPSDLPPGNYSVDIDAGVTSRSVGVRVGSQKQAILDVGGDIHPGRQVLVIDNATLPHGGYVVVSGANRTVGTSGYLPAGTHQNVGVFVGNTTGERRHLTVELWYGSPGYPCAPYSDAAGESRQRVNAEPN